MSSERRWPPVFLGLSLLANIFLVGVMTGHGFADRPGPGKAVPRPPAGWIHPNALMPEEKKGFSAIMRAHRDAIDEKRRALRDAKAALEAAIGSPSYDRPKVESAFADMRRASVASQEANQSALAEAMETLGPTARAALIAPVQPPR